MILANDIPAGEFEIFLHAENSNKDLIAMLQSKEKQ